MAIDLTKKPLENPEDSSSDSGNGVSLDKTTASTNSPRNVSSRVNIPVPPSAAQNSQGQTAGQVVEDLSAWQYYLKVFQLYGNMSGRARRKEYWGFALYTTIISFMLGFLDGLWGTGGEYGLAYSLYALAAFIPGIAVWVRRMHDVGRSGWWFLIYFTGIGALVLLYWMFKDSEPGPNKWGPNPKGVN